MRFLFRQLITYEHAIYYRPEISFPGHSHRGEDHAGN
jgi:hypothetical protein